MQNTAQGLVVLQALADSGHRVAQFNLGVMHDTGQGAVQDFAQAAHWYRLAARQGHAAAQFNLGGLYYEGQGVARDLVRASVWFSLAAVAGFDGAARNRNGVASLLNADELAQAQALIRVCQQSLPTDCN
jgi:TPR repeat protein